LRRLVNYWWLSPAGAPLFDLAAPLPSYSFRDGCGAAAESLVVTLVNDLVKMLGAERRGILQTRRAAHLALRRMMLRRSWFGRLGLRLGVVA